MKKDQTLENSPSFLLAITVPGLVLDHMCVPGFESQYDGPEMFKKYLCLGWQEGKALREAFEKACRMEVHLEPWINGSISVSIRLFSSEEPNKYFQVDATIRDGQFVDGISSGGRTIEGKGKKE